MAPYADSLPPRLLGTAPAAGAVAGTPGKFTPWNAKRPANLAALQAAGALGQVAAWAPGQSVQLRNGSSAHWAGAAWVAGVAPAPVGVAARRTTAQPDAQGRVLEVDPDSPVPGVIMETTADVPDVALPDALTVAAGTPGSYDPAQTAAQRPRNITELRTRATPADVAAWLPGQYVLVGENGKRAHWDGATWQRGESPQVSAPADRSTVPDGTVPGE